MKLITNWLNNRKQRKLEIQQALQLKQKLEEEQRMEQIKYEAIMSSDVPWYKTIGEPYNLENPPIEPVSERYQWNKAFILKLRREGYVGESDAEVIRDWETKIEAERIKRVAELERESKRNSSEPWIEVISEKYNEDTKQVEMRLDWNTAFIKMLRRNGYSGRDDREIVDRWFKRLSDDIAKDIHGTSYEG